MAGAAIIDGFDAHDGHVLCKGHVGVAVIPAALAFADDLALEDWDELLSLVLLGYEIGTRSGIALHASAPTMHSSGAWNALAAAAIGARALRLSDEQIAHALGIAEYYGPRSPLMRIIERPTMLKDGSTMGAFAGVTAAYLAEDGFTGAPAETVDLDAGSRDSTLWRDLGTRWRILEQYFKPYPVCRWTQPAAEAILALRRTHPGITHTDVRSVEVESFHEAVSLGCRVPVETDAAQYSLPFVVAATLVHGRLTPAEITGAGLHDPAVLGLSRDDVARRDRRVQHALSRRAMGARATHAARRDASRQRTAHDGGRSRHAVERRRAVREISDERRGRARRPRSATDRGRDPDAGARRQAVRISRYRLPSAVGEIGSETTISCISRAGMFESRL